MSARYDNLLAIAKILRRMPVLYPIARRYNLWRHDFIMRNIAHLLDASRDAVTEGNTHIGNIARCGLPTQSNDTIWLFWWQGITHAPSIVKACYSSVCRNAGGRHVVLVTKGNIHEFAMFPQYIYDLIDRGVITLTHLSDLLRFNLLALYGGLWLDVTVFAAGPVPLTGSDGVFTCGGYPDPSEFNVSRGNWTGFVVGGKTGDTLFRFMDDFFMRYWRERDGLIDYFLIDYALAYANEMNIGDFRDACGRGRGIQPCLFDLQPILAHRFDGRIWNTITESTTLFKLSYKKMRAIRPGSFAQTLLSDMDETGGIA